MDEKSTEGQQAKTYLYFEDLMRFMTEQMYASGPLADLIRSGIVLAPLSGDEKMSLWERLKLKVALYFYLRRNPECRNHFFFQKDILGVSALAFECCSEPEEKKVMLLRASEKAHLIAEEVQLFPQPIVVVVWKTDGDNALISAAHKIAHAVIARQPDFQLFDFPKADGVILVNGKSVIRFDPKK
jgi:hypothetical protein